MPLILSNFDKANVWNELERIIPWRIESFVLEIWILKYLFLKHLKGNEFFMDPQIVSIGNMYTLKQQNFNKVDELISGSDENCR